MSMTRAEAAPSEKRALDSLYATAIFLGAFLLFQIQPMIGRYLLPWFGGAVSVWATSLVFFTTALSAGYLYAYIVTRLSHGNQVLVHIVVAALSGILVAARLLVTHAAYPSLAWLSESQIAPAMRLLGALGYTIGIPYFLLASTAPLLQHWYTAETGKEPYRFYALSNFGSFIALGTYPFVIEPLLPLSVQQVVWSVLFVAFVVCLMTLAGLHRKAVRRAVDAAPDVPGAASAIATSRILAWLALAALPAAMQVATTSRITQTLVPVPFLWVIPLSLYLLSFVIAFRGWASGGVTPLLVLVAALVSYLYMDWSVLNALPQMLASIALFFFGSLYCNAILYQLRPAAHASSLYYLWISIGGALGTLAFALGAPLVFVNFSEYQLGAVAFVIIAIACFPAMTYVRDPYRQHTYAIRIVLVVLVLGGFAYRELTTESDALYRSRNFYGLVEVSQSRTKRDLTHGRTLHGSQFRDPKAARIPTTYYSRTSGVGRAILQAQADRGGEGVNVGVIGLGAGTIAAYCRNGDKFVYYEIDPRMALVARRYFTYLAGCPNLDVRIGDGRLTLEKERNEHRTGQYDVLVVDAFSDDTIPVHLLTKEAVRLYLDQLRGPKSILAIHTSNRYFDLPPIVVRVADELNLASKVINDSGRRSDRNDGEDGDGGNHAEGGDPSDGATLSEWVLISKDASELQLPIFAKGALDSTVALTSLWTDDYANVFSAVYWQNLRLWASGRRTRASGSDDD